MSVSATPSLPSAQAPVDPQPVSAALRRHFEEELSAIESGKTVRIGAAVTTVGVQAGAAVRRGPWTGAAWAGREWVRGGWLAGLSVGASW